MSDLPPSKHESVQGLDSGSVEGQRQPQPVWICSDAQKPKK